MRFTQVVMLALLVACSNDGPTPPIIGDDPSAILGQYTLTTVNGSAALPVTIDSTAALVVSVGDAWFWLYSDGTYKGGTTVYEVSPTVGKSLPFTIGGTYALHGATLTFVATSGPSLQPATVVGANIRHVYSVRAGRAADTLVFQPKPVICPNGC